MPLPVPDAPTTTESHPTLPAAVHLQLACVVTLTEIVPPDASTDSDVLDSVNVVQEGAGTGVAPPCVTATDWPAIVNAPVRAALEGLGAAVNCTLPAPFPDAPLTMVSHPSALDAVHSQPSETVTLTEAEPPAGATVTAVLDSTKVHTGGVGGVPSAAD